MPGAPATLPRPGLPHSDSAVSLADAAEAAEGRGVRDVTVPGQPLSRTRPLRSVEEAGSAPLIWSPLLNRGLCFSQAEREALGLEGLLPPAVETLEAQAARVVHQLRAECAGPFERYSRLSWLAATNVTLFYYVLVNNLTELAPVVYTPTVGEACRKFSGHYRGPAGLYVDAVRGRDRFGACLANWPNHNVQIVVLTDGSRVLGLGDLGIGGIGISVGKIQLYVAGGGFHPEHSLPIVMDTGTNNQELLDDPFYLGARSRRLSDDEVADAVDDLCAAIKARWPHCLIQFEDFSTNKAFLILNKLRHKYFCFNDDIQGTSTVLTSGFLNGMRAQGTPLADARLVLFGAGSSAIGVGEMIAATVAADTGISLDEARSRIFVMDSKGLITTTRGDWATLPDHKRSLARTDGTPDMKTLVEIILHVKPHALIGLSGQGQSFKEDALAALASVTPRPLVMPCSNPTSNAEATPEQVYAWTGGKAIVATGSPFDPVTLPDGSVATPGQANNFYCFPSIGLGAVLVKSTAVTDGMLQAAAHALAATVPDAEVATGTLYPPLTDMRRTTLAVATAVAEAAFADGVATVPKPADMVRYVADRMYWPGGAAPENWGATVADVAKAHG